MLQTFNLVNGLASGAILEFGAATGMAQYAWLMIAIPFVSSMFLLIAGRRVDSWGHYLGMLAPWASFVIGVVILAEMLGRSPENRAQTLTVWNWLPGSEVNVNFGLLLDPLSISFVMLVTFVGGLIHIYSVGYMAADPDRRRFFAYLNFFVASMLTLVLGSSYLVTFVGWEGVGLASYLLIGFWNQVHNNALAANKAFIMNRVGDLGLLLAMMSMFAVVGSVDFADVLGVTLRPGWATAIGLFLLLAACGKSAQFPLQAWLGDAMAGPTPVSALIHAATMVTAGVYLMVRSGAIYTQTPVASLVVAIVGAITLLFGAIVGCAKDDMKKVLAASTMSQIGYMMLGAGLGPVGWAFAIFHLITHGFFKAQLFLSAGAVMHAMGEQVNIRRFGGLFKVMPAVLRVLLQGQNHRGGFPAQPELRNLVSLGVRSHRPVRCRYHRVLYVPPVLPHLPRGGPVDHRSGRRPGPSARGRSVDDHSAPGAVRVLHCARWPALGR